MMTEPQTLEGQAVEEPTETPEPNGKQEIIRHPDRTPLSQRDPVALAQHFAQSGYFADARQMSQAVVKIVAGEELGFGPMTAMAGIHIIEGKPSLSANLLATCVKRPKLPGGEGNPYTYRVKAINAEKAAVTFYERGPDGEMHDLGTSEFTIEMARRAKLVRDGSGWVKYPEAMLFARALTQGVRWFCPDVTAGAPAYTPEELGAEVDEHGDVVKLPQSTAATAPADEGPKLDSERVDWLEKGVEALAPTYAAKDLLLGSCGIDGLRAKSKKALRERLEGLTPDQADALEHELQEAADSEAESDD